MNTNAPTPSIYPHPDIPGWATGRQSSGKRFALRVSHIVSCFENDEGEVLIYSGQGPHVTIHGDFDEVERVIQTVKGLVK